MNKLTDILTKEYMSKLDALSYQMTARLSAGYGGARRAKGKGGSLEFSDFRAYADGDDLRRIDWKGYARSDKLFVKLFMEEKQATFNFFLDNSASMAFGEGEKGLYAKTLAASLGYIFLRSTDRVNLFTVDTALSLSRGGLASKARFYELADALEKMPFSGETALGAALSQSREHRLGSGVSFVFSDFFSPDGFEEGVLALARKGQQVALVCLLSPEETMPVLDGPLRLVDAETGQAREVRVTAEVLAQYAKALEAHKERLRAFAARHGFTYIFADTGTHPLETVGEILRGAQ